MEATIEKVSPKKPNKFKEFFKDQKKRAIKYKSILWFVLPLMIICLLLSYIPMLGISFSFKESIRPGFLLHDIFCTGCGNSYCVASGFNPGWTFTHYAAIFQDEYFLSAVSNTLVISSLKLIIIFPLTIMFAIMLSEVKNQKLSKFILIITCLPNFISWPVTLGIFQNILAQQSGLLNNILFMINSNHKPIDFLNDYYMFLVVFLAAWKQIGWGSIMYYSTIIAIDKSYYEAASIDGATKLQKIRYLTIPSLKPMIALMLVMNITYIMDAGFDQIYPMLKMVPSKTYDYQILGTYIFNLVQEGASYAFTVALSVFNGLIAVTLMLSGNALVKKFLNRSLW